MDNLRRADSDLKGQHGIAGAGTVAPNSETVFTDQGGYIGVVEGVGITVFVEQIKSAAVFERGDTVNLGVGDGFVPADLHIELGAGAEHAGDGGGGLVGLGGGVKG